MSANSERLRIISRGFPFYLLLVLLFLMLLRAMNRRKKMNTINEIYKDIYSLLIEIGFKIPQAQYITAQAAHETGNFTSDIFKNNHNLFGMKLARVRDTTAIGERKNHAVYKDLAESIKDYKIYFENFGYLQTYTSVDSFVEALKEKKYFEADTEEYKKGVTHFYNLYFK